MGEIALTVLGMMTLLAGVSVLLPVANRYNIPYTVMLAAVGVVLGGLVLVLGAPERWWLAGDVLHAIDRLDLTAEALFYIFLPTLIFESALSINVHRLLEDLAPILALAIVGLLISAFAIAGAIWLAADVALVACLLLGAIVSATDPVAVVALFRDLGAPRRLTILVEGESLFNDATAIVLFTLLSAMIVGSGESGVVAGAGRFLVVFCGGSVVGFLASMAVCALIGRLRNVPVVEVTLTICLAYLVFILAEHYLHVSGVMAVVTAALVVGTYGRTQLSPSAWRLLEEIWEHLAFWANSLIFVLVGLLVPHLLLDIGVDELGLLAILIAAAVAARALIIFALLPALSRLGWASPIEQAYRWVMLWGGLRGAVSLALALIVMESAGFDDELRRLVVLLVTGFVLFTLFVQATTIRPLLGLFHLDELDPAEQALRNRALALTLSHIQRVIDKVAASYQVEPALVRQVSADYETRLAAARREIETGEALSDADRVRIALEALVRHERRLYLQHFDEGVVSPGITRILLAEAERILDGAKAGGPAGYRAAAAKVLGFPLSVRAALYLHRRYRLQGPLAKRLEDRFEVMMAAETVLVELQDYCEEIIGSLLGGGIEAEVAEVLRARQHATATALDALRLQYPEYATTLRRRLLERVALRLEDQDYRHLLDEAAVSREVFNDLRQDLQRRESQFRDRPALDLHLAREELVAKVPFFADLPTARLAEIAKLLKPRLVLPGERVVHEGETGDAMYFISSGAVEVALAGAPVRLGSGDFFGEIALVKDVRRTADVVALGYCRCLTLYVRDFEALLSRQPELKQTITEVAEARLATHGTLPPES
ncbi:MAG: cation:proton antiporter [Alphaproteobacteria bacterium]|jgi:CPA1 family monovalent cation:H+ antiporter|nr:cation:proton antiporter [Alphaproteobacteria bacterium]